MNEPFPADSLAAIYISVKEKMGADAAHQFASFLARLSDGNTSSEQVLHDALSKMGLPMLLPDEKRLAYFADRLRTQPTDPFADEGHHGNHQVRPESPRVG